MRTLVKILVAALIGVGATVAVAAPASAGSTYTCGAAGYQCLTPYGYDGQSHYGYPVNSVGGNCTNYVAFRLGQAYGASRSGLWQGLGDAGSWAATAAGRSGVVVDHTPSVGAVAQWSTGNHVAYVDAVNGDGSITISESSWTVSSSGRDSYIRKITPNSPNTAASYYNDGWPTSFIHFGGAVSSTPPQVTPQPNSLPPHTYPTSGAARVRAGASTATAVLGTTTPGQQVTLDCYVLGQSVSGTAIWDHVPALGGFISDSLIITGSAGAVVPLCSSGSPQDLTPLNGTAYIFPLSTSYNPNTNQQSNSMAITSTTSTIHVDCWVLGNFVTAQGTGGSFSDKVWYHVPSAPGWVPDAQVHTSINNSSDRPPFAQCGQGVVQGPFLAIGSTTFRSSASASAPALTTVSSGTKFTGIDCTLTSDSVTNPQTGQTNTLWDHIAGYGYVPDVFVLTGLDSAVAPTCATTTDTNAAPAGTTPPVVTGTPAVGSTVTATTVYTASAATPLPKAGSVAGSGYRLESDAASTLPAAHAASDWVAGSKFEYQWLADGEPIVGARTATLKVTSDLLGKTLSVSVVGGKAGYDQAGVSSGSTTTVSKPVIAHGAGSTTAAAVLRVGGLAKITAFGTWSPKPTSAAYQWFADDTAIPGATKSSLIIPAAAAGHQLKLQMTLTRAGYEPSIINIAWPANAKVTISATPKITGTVKVARTLTVTPGEWTPGTTFTYQWYANGKAISGATNPTLKLSSSTKGTKITVKVKGTLADYATVVMSSKATAAVVK